MPGTTGIVVTDGTPPSGVSDMDGMLVAGTSVAVTAGSSAVLPAGGVSRGSVDAGSVVVVD